MSTGTPAGSADAEADRLQAPPATAPGSASALLPLDGFVPRSTCGTDPAAIAERCESALSALATCVNCNARVEDKRYEEVRSALAALSQQLNLIEAKQQQLFDLVNFEISRGSAVPPSPELESSPP